MFDDLTLIKRYACDGAITTFPIPFPFKNDDHILVKIIDDATGLDSDLVNPDDYTIENSCVETVDVWGIGYTLFIKRVLPLIQESDYIENDELPAATLEWDSDKVVQMIQQLAEAVGRAALLRDVSEYSGIELPDPDEGMTLVWRGGNLTNGYPFGANYLIQAFMETFLESVDLDTAQGNLGISDFVKTILNDADAGAVLTTLGVSAFVQTLLDDVDAGAFFTTLGISAFIQTLLDDVDAATARGTLDVAQHDEITDDDGDTKIEVEKNADEDIIRVTAGGTEVSELKDGACDVLKIDNLTARVTQGALVDGIDYTETVKDCRLQVEATATDKDAILKLISKSGFWKIYIDESDAQRLKFEDDDGVEMYLKKTGVLYIDGTYETFSPEMPDMEGYDWVELAKDIAMKPNKPKDMKIGDMTEEDEEKYGKDIAKIAMANTRAIVYMAGVQKQLVAKIDEQQKRIEKIEKTVGLLQ